MVVTAMGQPLPEAAPVGRASLDGDSVVVGCATGALRLLRLQPEGRKPMSAQAFANGYDALLQASWGDPPPSPRPPLTRPAS